MICRRREDVLGQSGVPAPPPPLPSPRPRSNDPSPRLHRLPLSLSPSPSPSHRITHEIHRHVRVHRHRHPEREIDRRHPPRRDDRRGHESRQRERRRVIDPHHRLPSIGGEHGGRAGGRVNEVRGRAITQSSVTQSLIHASSAGHRAMIDYLKIRHTGARDGDQGPDAVVAR